LSGCRIFWIPLDKENEDTLVAFEKQALTIIFLEVMTDATPPIVSTIAEDIEKIVRVTRFDGWQKTVAGEGEIKRVLRDTFF
jgi:type I restriction enzyme R subunit